MSARGDLASLPHRTACAAYRATNLSLMTPLPTPTERGDMLGFFRAKVVPVVAAAATVMSLSGCELPVVPSGDGGRPSRNAAIAAAAEGKLTLRIVPEDKGPRTYYFGDATEPVGLAGLVNKLETARRLRPSETTLHLYTYPGVNGYDVVVAMRAASRMGIQRVEGVADFTDDASFLARMRWQHWSETLEPLPQRPERPDSVVNK